MPNDILLDDNFDLVIKDGDFVIGESTYQHQNCLLFADKGEFKNYPKTGVGSRRFLESERPNDFAREIRQEFIADGMNVENIRINNDLEVEVVAEYKQK